VFPSFKASGKVPLSASTFAADHLRRAATKARVRIPEGYHFGDHDLRHSLSNWMVNNAKVDPKTVQGILRHSQIQTTLDLYTQGAQMKHGQLRVRFSRRCERTQALCDIVGWIVDWGFAVKMP
jgi:integrase